MCILAPENSALSFHSYHVPVFRVGEKQSTHPPLPVKWGVCTTHQLTNQLVAWLIDSYRLVWVSDPVHSCTQTPSIFTSLWNYQCQNQFFIPFLYFFWPLPFIRTTIFIYFTMYCICPFFRCCGAVARVAAAVVCSAAANTAAAVAAAHCCCRGLPNWSFCCKLHKLLPCSAAPLQGVPL